MRTDRQRFVLLTGMACCVLVLAFSTGWLVRPRLGSGVNRAGLLKLRTGMSEAEIQQLLGPPLSRRKAVGPHPIRQEARWTGEWIWSYGEQGLLGFGSGVEIWMKVENGCLSSAGAERFDLGIWWCTPRECPRVLDRKAFERLPSH